MIGFMEKQGKYSVTTFESFKNELKGSYGDMSLRWNAALAMFLTADPNEQEAWIQRLIVAKRTAGAKTTLQRVRELVQGRAVEPTHQPDATAVQRAAEYLNEQAAAAAREKAERDRPPQKTRKRA